MLRIEFSDLSWPKKYRLDEFAAILPERLLLALVGYFAGMEKGDRIVEFPSRHVLKKCLCHYYGTLVAEGKMSWDEVMGDLKEGFETLNEIPISRKEVKRLFLQRKKEIKKEKS